MINVIVESSKYIILTLMIVYTFHCFYTVRQSDEEDRNELLRQQLLLIFFIDFTAFLVLYLKTFNFKIVEFYAEMLLFFAAIQILYRMLYKKASILLLNNMCMLLSVGFIMLCRLDISSAQKQLLIAAGVSAIALVIPVMIRKMRFLRRLTWVYAGIGIILLAAVFALARTSYGAKLSLLGVQPSEAIKITFVFFMASFLSRDTSFKAIVQVTVVAALHVGILVLSKDLGSALIFFVAYMTMLFVATSSYLWFGAGIAGGSLAAVAAYYLFPHVRRRVEAWADPWSDIANKGYQVAQALFAIGTGGWFGMGLYRGMPEKIPVVDKDFVFAAISEEMGALYALCVLFLCLGCYMQFMLIAMKMQAMFYKLIAFGLGSVYITQVFLTIGGVTKFIPSTGVTLPLVSYGGSSIVSTFIIFQVIQGLYVLKRGEEEEEEHSSEEE